MKMHRSKKSARNHRGIALVIMLVFLVLLVGLVVAFFSRAVTERQVANSSAHQTKVEVFAEGAVETLVGDLKQEIAAGSTTPSPTPNPAPNTNLYFPKTGATAVPYRVGTVDALPNLVKRSAYQQPFYAGTNYDTNSYAASNRAAHVSANTLSQNNRSFSVTRWNKPLLLPKQNPDSDTDFTPVTGSTGFTAPDWVLVARDGSNPTEWTGALGNGSSSNFVLGRYAYTIYDEGGLLDMNAAGYPTGTTVQQAGGKNALAFADLTQLLDGTGQPLLKQTDIDAIVSWRNYATTQAPSDFPTPAFTATSALNYYKALTISSRGFLTTANTALFNNQSDRMFTSRQQLMKLLLSGIASQGSEDTDKAERARLQNALQYLTHFTRDLNQPSYAPDAQRPKIVSTASGGNDAIGGDDVINPSFLTVRVATAKTGGRNDGSDLKEGEPLVKKRFALNRLAWLTYKGPIASDSGTLSTDPELQTVITSLKNAGFTDAFLQQGGPSNIYKYFGLSWVTDPDEPTAKLWVYSHQGTSPLTSASPPQANIKTLSGGSNSVSGREPDFVELLRATVCAGAVGKASATVNPNNPDGYQAQRDIGEAGAIIQIAANIIDQFDCDGYPTRILYDDGSWPKPQVYRGVEDLPYFYRTRGGLMKLAESVPPITSSQPDATAGTVAAGHEGLGVALEEPEIWNPHGWNASATVPGPRPTTFRITAVTAPPSQLAPSSPDPNAFVAQPRNRYIASGYQTCPPSNAPLKSISWTQDNTALLFDIPTDRLDLFREPTLLIKPTIPTGSNLRLGPLNYLMREAVLNPYTGGGGILNIAQSPFYMSSGLTDNRVYIGMYIGAFPLLWNATINGVQSYCNAYQVTPPSGKPATYRVQYETTPGSGKWITYDEKYRAVSINGGGINLQNVSGSRRNWIEPSYAIGNDNGLAYTDPRTARLGAVANAWQYNQSRQIFEWPPMYSSYGSNYAGSQKAGPAAATNPYAAADATNAARQNAVWTLRPDDGSGYTAWPYPSGLGFYQSGMTANNAGPQFRPGLYSQNNPAVTTNSGLTRYGNVGQGSGGTQGYFADPDNVVRRGMSAYVQPDAGTPAPAVAPSAGAASGLPMKVANTFSAAGIATQNTEGDSRPIVLNRPFRTVAELGYAHSDVPWRNLDVSTPESGFNPLLDVFCINDTENTAGLAAGKVNLNTRQAPVLTAILAGACKNEFTSSTVIGTTGNASANLIATELVRRTSDTAAALGTGSGPVRNISELVGKWSSSVKARNGNSTGPAIDGSQSYVGFSGLATTSTAALKDPPNLSYILQQDSSITGYNTQVVQRYRESVIRALTSASQTRVWNLMVDLVAQTGRYPQSATGLDQFIVEGEQRLWVHLAIDRYTGEVIDRQVEVVKE